MSPETHEHLITATLLVASVIFLGVAIWCS
jgi:hypothetical protein